MFWYTFTAVYLTAAHTFTVCAANDCNARDQARRVASRALAIVLRRVES